jgi:hypothetical protein
VSSGRSSNFSDSFFLSASAAALSLARANSAYASSRACSKEIRGVGFPAAKGKTIQLSRATESKEASRISCRMEKLSTDLDVPGSFSFARWIAFSRHGPRRRLRLRLQASAALGREDGVAVAFGQLRAIMHQTRACPPRIGQRCPNIGGAASILKKLQQMR